MSAETFRWAGPAWLPAKPRAPEQLPPLSPHKKAGLGIHNPFWGSRFTVFLGFEIHNPLWVLGDDLQPCGRFVAGGELGVLYRTKGTPSGVSCSGGLWKGKWGHP